MKRGLKKVTLLAAVFAVCAVFSLSAQTPPDAAAPEKSSSFVIGARVGVNASEFLVSQSTKATNMLSGAQVTAFAMYNFNNWVGSSLEVGFAQSGAANFKTADGRVHDYRLSNVQANLLSYFKLPVLSVYEPKFFIGPSFDFNVHATDNVEGVSFGRPIKARYDATNNFKPMDIGLIVGTGVDFDLKWATLMLDVRYRHGLSDINNKYGMSGNAPFIDSGAGNQDIRTRGLSVQAGLGFKL